MTSLQHGPRALKPFKSEILFSTHAFQRLKWGTKPESYVRDPEFARALPVYGPTCQSVGPAAVPHRNCRTTANSMDEIVSDPQHIDGRNFRTRASRCEYSGVDYGAIATGQNWVSTESELLFATEYGLTIPSLLFETFASLSVER